MLANVCLFELMCHNRHVTYTIAGNRNQYIVEKYLGSIPLSPRWWGNIPDVFKDKPAITNILASDEHSAVFGIKLSPSTRTAGDEGCQFTQLSNLPILRNNPHLSLLIPRPHTHTTPMRCRCPATRAARVSISAVSCGSEVA